MHKISNGVVSFFEEEMDYIRFIKNLHKFAIFYIYSNMLFYLLPRSLNYFVSNFDGRIDKKKIYLVTKNSSGREFECESKKLFPDHESATFQRVYPKGNAARALSPYNLSRK